MPGPAGAGESLAFSPGFQVCRSPRLPPGVTRWGPTHLPEERTGPEGLECQYSEWVTGQLTPLAGGRFPHRASPLPITCGLQDQMSFRMASRTEI